MADKAATKQNERQRWTKHRIRMPDTRTDRWLWLKRTYDISTDESLVHDSCTSNRNQLISTSRTKWRNEKENKTNRKSWGRCPTEFVSARTRCMCRISVLSHSLRISEYILAVASLPCPCALVSLAVVWTWGTTLKLAKPFTSDHLLLDLITTDYECHTHISRIPLSDRSCTAILRRARSSPARVREWCDWRWYQKKVRRTWAAISSGDR